MKDQLCIADEVSLRAVLGRALQRVPGRRTSRDRGGLRIALSPASWGVSDVPEWGHQLDAERVLSEVWSLGIAAIEAGPPGFLPGASAQRKLLTPPHPPPPAPAPR